MLFTLTRYIFYPIIAIHPAGTSVSIVPGKSLIARSSSNRKQVSNLLLC